MTLIKSISRIRGTIGGKVGGFITFDTVRFTSAYGVGYKTDVKKVSTVVRKGC